MRELVVLGSASQAPTRYRNHNGYLLRWDGDDILFDPGEGTQRQLVLADARVGSIERICITHFHGDHCLGLPGVVQRMSLDGVPHPVELCYPAASVTPSTCSTHRCSTAASRCGGARSTPTVWSTLVLPTPCAQRAWRTSPRPMAGASRSRPDG
jgi:ribonuclease BN (tRNA processing enzyme)